jgi:hypothetical protein
MTLTPPGRLQVSGKFVRLEDGENFVGAPTGTRIPRGQRKEAVR